MKHANILQQWLNGTPVQMLVSGVWKDLESPSAVAYTYDFHDMSTYRLKPEEQHRYLRCYKDHCNNTTFDRVYVEWQPESNLKLTFIDNHLTNAEVI